MRRRKIDHLAGQAAASESGFGVVVEVRQVIGGWSSWLTVYYRGAGDRSDRFPVIPDEIAGNVAVKSTDKPHRFTSRQDCVEAANYAAAEMRRQLSEELGV